MKGDYKLQTTIEQRLCVDIIAPSGNVIGAAYLYDTDSENPKMQIPEPIGVNVILSILMPWTQEKELDTRDSSLAFVPVMDRIRVDVAVGCGNRFEGIAWISDSYETNFALQVPKQIGYKSIVAILTEWIEYVQNSK